MGTKPESPFDMEDVEKIKGLLITVLDQLETDYNKNLVANYDSCATVFCIELTNIDDALYFVLFHDGLHTEYITAMKHALK